MKKNIGLGVLVLLCAIAASVSPKTQAHAAIPVLAGVGGGEPIPLDPSGPLPGTSCDQKPVPQGCPAVVAKQAPKLPERRQ